MSAAGAPDVPSALTRAPVDKQGLAANGRGLADEWPTPTNRGVCKTPRLGC